MVSLVRVPEGVDTPHPVVLREIDIEYPLVKLGDWLVVGKIEATPSGNLAFQFTSDHGDGRAIAERLSHPLECEHCGFSRRRKDGFVLRSLGSGEFKQVGSACLEDFTGIDPAAVLFLAKIFNFIRGASEDLDLFARSGRANAVSAERFLATVVHLVDRDGFVSSTGARERMVPATWEVAAGMVRSGSGIPESEEQERIARAREVRDWWINKGETSLFERNVKTVLASGVLEMEPRQLAIAAAAVPTYRAALKAQAVAGTSIHVGEPGEKRRAVLTVDRVIPMEGIYGPAWLVLFADASGNRLAWRSAAVPMDIRSGAGKTLEASFKVKGHDEWKGVKQTAVTHLKHLGWVAPKEALQSEDAPDDVERIEAGWRP